VNVYRTLKPGQAGTARFVRRYGDQLVAVRYRTDREEMRRYTTVEIIVDEDAYRPRVKTVVGVQVRLDEPVLRGRVRAAGGVWNPRKRVWELPYSAVLALDLADRAQPL